MQPEGRGAHVRAISQFVAAQRLNGVVVAMPVDQLVDRPDAAIDKVAGAVRERVQGVINLIRPAVQADGGDIELVDVTEAGVVQIRFHGACHGCPSSTMTLQDGIERNLREKIPEITAVIPVP